jgi:hypothetical protein
MSGGADADIALLDGMLEEWERGEFWDAEPYADNVVFIRSGPDGGEYRGIEALGAAWRSPRRWRTWSRCGTAGSRDWRCTGTAMLP